MKMRKNEYAMLHNSFNNNIQNNINVIESYNIKLMLTLNIHHVTISAQATASSSNQLQCSKYCSGPEICTMWFNLQYNFLKNNVVSSFFAPFLNF